MEDNYMALLACILTPQTPEVVLRNMGLIRCNARIPRKGKVREFRLVDLKTNKIILISHKRKDFREKLAKINLFDYSVEDKSRLQYATYYEGTTYKNKYIVDISFS
ncbi:MAG: hypothetical protein R3Y64_09030 [Peptostreptococcaceae bacterium]